MPCEPTETATVNVIGAGGIGGMLAVYAQDRGHAVTVCSRRPVERLLIDSNEVEREVPVRCVTDPESLTPADWVFVATKAQDTAGTRDWLKYGTHPGSTTVVAQNGVEHHERVAPLEPAGEIVASIAFLPVERAADDRLIHRGPARLSVPAGAAGTRLAELFSGSALEVRTETDFTTASWYKLLTNLAANPITTLTRSRIGVFGDPDIRDFAHELLREAIAVARREGAALSEHAATEVLDAYLAYAPETGSSMLFDHLAGRPTEHDHITGAVVRAADRHGLPAPLNRAVLALLRNLEAGRRNHQDQ